ncbi:MAG TPA: DUF4157 domain-containing protein [Anaerolineaceae bacterium]|nr:DUF4157 domain-containing protein [Anaerolineaceae bacterium]
MAKTQNDHLKSHDKHLDNGLKKSEPLKTQIQQDQFGESVQLTHAIQTPEQANPNTIQLLQERYGNQEVRRIVEPVKTEESAVDQGGFLKKYVSDEIHRARSGGQPLQSGISDQMKPKFGNSIDNVRIHTDQNSDLISKKIQAKAFTIGNDIFFRKGAYSPNTEQGRHTLMHELTHVVQQSSRSISNAPLKLGEPDDKFEQEAEGFAQGNQSHVPTGSGKSDGVVQRFSLAGVKKSIGGIFSRGDKSGTTSTPTPAPVTPPPVPTIPAGLIQDEWVLIQKAGVVDKDDWRSIDPSKQRAIFDLIKTDFLIAQKLVSAHKASSWPTDDNGAEIFDAAKLKTINTTFMFDFSGWNSLKKEYKKLLFSFSAKPYIATLAVFAKADKWPKDGSDQDITDENIFKTITETWKISLAQWQSISDKNQRGFLLSNSGKSYSDELVRAAFQNKWPKNGSDQPILDDGLITKIRDDIGLNLWQWSQLASSARRGFLLSAAGTLTKAQLNELARSAISGIWPLNGGDQDISVASDWKKIKDAFPQMSPSYWNGFDKFTRTDALSKSDVAGVKEVINKANFTRDSKEGAMDKIGGVAGHGATDAVLGTIGLAGSITGLSKGTGDNADIDRGSASVGAVADAGNVMASGGSLLGSIAQLRRGNKLAGENRSKASQEVGKKQQSKGRWGITQSVFGLAGSSASFSGNVIKANDPTSDSASNASGGLGVASGFLGMFGSALGVGKGSASMHSARKRSGLAKTFVEEGATTGSDSEKLSNIAKLTAKSQNKTGKGLGIFKGVTSFLGSALGSAGSIGGLAGMGKESGFGLGIAGAALSGIGILGGIGQMIAESKGKPDEAELTQQAKNLIELLRNPSGPQRRRAAEFVKNVLKINLVDLNDDKTWSAWIEEDEEAATALIKSKLSKF